MLLISFIVLLVGMDIQNIPDFIHLIFWLLIVRIGIIIIRKRVNRRWKGTCLRCLRLDSRCILLPLSLISQLIVDVWIQTCNLVVINQYSYLALPIPQLLPLLLHLLPRAESLGKGLVLNQDIGSLGWKFISLHLDVSNVSVPAENRWKVLLIGVLWVIADRSVKHWYQMLLYLIHGVVAYDIEPFQMVSEEYLEVVIMGRVKSSVDVVIVRASIGGVLYLEIFNKHKVLDYLHIFNFSVFPEKWFYRLLSSIKQPTHVQLSHQNALVDPFRGLCLLHQLFLLGLRQSSINLMQCVVISDGIVPYSQTYFLLSLFSLDLLIIATFLWARARMPSMMTLISSPIFIIPFVMVIPISFSMLTWVRSRSSPRPVLLDVSAVAIPLFLPLISHQIINYCKSYIHSTRIPKILT